MAWNMKKVVFVLTITILFVGFGEAIPCGPAQRNNGTTCVQCHDKTYMPELEHEFTECRPCTQSNKFGILVIETCNRTHDAKLGCKRGFRKQFTYEEGHQFDCLCDSSQLKIVKNGTNGTVNNDDVYCGEDNDANIGWIVAVVVLSVILLVVILIVLWRNRRAIREILCKT